MQKDLFKDLREENMETVEQLATGETQPSFFERVRIVLTLDKIILWGLLNITAIVFIYSAGIEHGMTVARNGVGLDAKAIAPKTVENVPELSAQDTQTPPAEVPSSSASLPAEAVKEEPTANLKDGNFTIQLVTYKSKDQAQGEVTRLSQKGHKAFIISSGKFHQVCVEKFEKKLDASQKLVEFKSEGFARIYQGAYVRTVKNG